MTKQTTKKIKERQQEHKLALWCMKQAKAYKEGTLEKWKIDKLKKVKFPFDRYYREYKQLVRECKKMRR